MKHTFPLFVLSLIATTIVHAEVFPGPHYVEEPDPYASPYAEVGGTLTYAGSNSPQSLNCFIDNNTFSHMVFGLLYPTLLGSDAVTDELAPSIAKQWEISEDKCTFTFTLDERAKWSDNNIYTARDVKKTFDTIKNPYCSNPYRVVLSQISSPEILDDCTIRFTASEIHWQNIYKIGANIYIMPYRFIEKKENEVRNDETVYNRLKNEAEQDAKKVDELYKEIEKSAENFHLTNEEHKQQLNAYLTSAKENAEELKKFIGFAKSLNANDLSQKLEAYAANAIVFDGRHILDKNELENLMVNAEAFKNICFEFDIVGGPYKLEKHKPGVEIVLKRRNDWWVFNTPSGQGIYNFDKIRIRFFLSQDNALEAFKKGEVDMIPVYSARQWETQTDGEAFYKNWIVKQKVNNLSAVGFQGIVMNIRKKPYDDIRVRKALAKLFDSRRMVKELMFNAYDIYGSFFEDLYDAPEYKDLRPSHIEFDRHEAYNLLMDAGFKLDRKTGKMLKPDGEPFVINMLITQKSPFLAVFKNSLKGLGIDMEIQQIDFGAWMNKTGNLDYEVTNCAFSGSILRDPEPMWHSKNKNVKMGVNRPGYANPEVDKLIEAMKTEFSLEKRNEMLRKIDKMLTDDVPYILSWYIRATRLLYWNKFGTPSNVLGKRGDEMSIPAYWWYDANSAAELKHAMDKSLPLPARHPNPTFAETKASKNRIERNKKAKEQSVVLP